MAKIADALSVPLAALLNDEFASYQSLGLFTAATVLSDSDEDK
jgi:hypothetical protein